MNERKPFSRRELLICFMAGGMVVAGKLWIPGPTKIFLPIKKIVRTGIFTVKGTLTVHFEDMVREAGEARININGIEWLYHPVL